MLVTATLLEAALAWPVAPVVVRHAARIQPLIVEVVMAAVSALPSASDRPTRSKDLKALDRQLPLVAKGDPVEIDLALVHRQKSLLAAIQLCIQAAGLQEKEVYLPLGIDASHWTRIMKGDAHFPLDRLGPLMDLCGNEAPLMWLAHHRGFGLHRLETALERENRELREQLAEEKRKAKWAVDLFAGRAV